MALITSNCGQNQSNGLISADDFNVKNLFQAILDGQNAGNCTYQFEKFDGNCTHLFDLNCTTNTSCNSWTESMSWSEPAYVEPPEPEPEPFDPEKAGGHTNPSFYILGIGPMIVSMFVNFFGGRIASLITLVTVFTSSASTAIGSALADKDPEENITPAQFMGVGAGIYAGSVATKVATGNIKFAYGVQGAAIGAMFSKASVMVWRPKVLWLVPELEPHMGWVDLTVASAMGAGMAWLSNAFKNIISVVCTAVIGTLGGVTVAAGYGIPGVENFTLVNLAANGIDCKDDDCWTAFGAIILLSVGGMMNQMKMEKLDINLPATSAYERFLQKLEKTMALIFKLSEFIEKASDLDTDELMEQCLAAREKLVKYASFTTNLTQFSLCFGFLADFITNALAGVYSAVPWAGGFTALLALVTPAQGFVGTLAAICNSEKFAGRVQEYTVPEFFLRDKYELPKKFKVFFPGPLKMIAHRMRFNSPFKKWMAKLPGGFRDSYIVEFTPIGHWMNQIAFVSALFMYYKWTVAQCDGPNHLELWAKSVHLDSGQLHFDRDGRHRIHDRRHVRGLG